MKAVERLDRAFELAEDTIGLVAFVQSYKEIQPFIRHFIDGSIHEREFINAVEWYRDDN